VYFHDNDLVRRRVRLALRALLPLLARRARATDLAALAATGGAPEIAWADVARL
jgi:hypothetical protein